MKYNNYIFDLYGTLVDIHTEENKIELWEKLALFYGYYDALYTPEELQADYLRLVAGQEADLHEAHPEIRIEYVFQELFHKKEVDADLTLAIHAGQFFRILSTDYIRLYPGVCELLSRLKDAGKKIYLLSNAQRIFTEYEMHTLGIVHYFDDIFISSEYGIKKPESRFFRLLIEKHGIDVKKSLMIGNDGTSDIAGAKSVGLNTCYIRSNISPKEPLPPADYVFPEMDMKRVMKLFEPTV